MVESRVKGTLLLDTACSNCGTVFYEQTSDTFALTGRPLVTECHECDFIGPPTVTERWAEPTDGGQTG